jgi:hypothetical protein
MAGNASVVWQVPFKYMEALFEMQHPRQYRNTGAGTVSVNVHVSSRRYCRGQFNIYRMAITLPASES